jgi:hypothetical protein
MGRTLTLRTADNQLVSLKAEEAAAGRLGYAYATTLHRSQGATTTRAHLFADGGGRELAYVAMSRAREGTHVWTVADGVGQAREDLVWEWASERRPTWAIDTGLPDPDQVDRETMAALAVTDRARVIALAGGQARLEAEALRSALPSDPAPKLDAAAAQLVRLRQGRAELEAGTGAHRRTPAGRAVSELRNARAKLRTAEDTAKHGRSWRDRHAARRMLPALTETANDARHDWDALVVPALQRLDVELAKVEAAVGQLTAAAQGHREVFEEPAHRWLEAASTYGALARGLDAYRDQLDGVCRAPVSERAAPARLGISSRCSPLAADGYPKIPLKAWRELRVKANSAPTTKFTPEVVSALMTMASPESAASNVVRPLRRVGLIDSDGQLTSRGHKWRLDASYPEACQEILDEVYPPDLLALTDDSGSPDPQRVLT